jgi:hypothetical protein
MKGMNATADSTPTQPPRKQQANSMMEILNIMTSYKNAVRNDHAHELMMRKGIRNGYIMFPVRLE